MKTKALLRIMMMLLPLLSGCSSPISGKPSAKTCPDLKQVVEAFYEANDTAQFATSLQYLTDDIVVIGWAEGANGHHMSMYSTAGKDQVQELLSKPGLKRSADQPDLPNYVMQETQLSGLKVSFKLIPDRLHPDKRPYNPYSVEAFFSGCQIEILKVVERVTWL